MMARRPPGIRGCRKTQLKQETKEVITMTEKKKEKTVPCGCGCQSFPKKDDERTPVKKEKKTKK